MGLPAGCPLMMFFMKRGMHDQDSPAGHNSADEHTDRDHDPLRKHGHQHPYGHGHA
ncbi:hypothetical protein ACFY0P_29125 [Streptomyces sp. NPDC001714]|uniref:hypothetical protein n=1 Tax=Streptomyces sp. NPDC001714 TaxID=3364603 RepID=UPI0036B664F6